jgi:hypothetical protein
MVSINKISPKYCYTVVSTAHSEVQYPILNPEIGYPHMVWLRAFIKMLG